jgi:hypothetical protein
MFNASYILSLVFNLIAIFRIKTYEDFDTNVPLMGMSIDVFHLMGKNKSGFVGNRHHISPKPSMILPRLLVFINESLSLLHLATQRSHFSALKNYFRLFSNKMCSYCLTDQATETQRLIYKYK